ncbi:probable inactive receptor kinase At5g58300 [Rhodamnia argentea]|uniref:Probable inactive receptor kinase At5g58300 n=1 Tax=Rhodamnia argentea TaxID=178133 RepID=A0A8B8Q1J8_9MYRT|nr:probable inactive receptor kinase At5g58300 [Rhodamnia argentea]XP_030540403.1 probable inactive receptor kinase At5g58300 [Rhodamnia argentea]XP_030540404.1 probable inactive receptor kinase At5g58300 [Rhodamnia argentea]XP_030540405.1 probable inactive receptor kinase At5g58300 [Rhodamnia argentea]XP_030540406.1 probable inactive receptor kinase At5g58300 [Rhodamnia argentea]XP_030540407.1 probable inactive receptor kinase At5g58300 [Rhodamnia argentea]XP_030540408.1 probable inactive re
MKLLQAVTPTTSLLFRVLLLIPLVVADLNSDIQALLDFASAVPHARKLNWSPSIPICSSWVGVTCNVDKSRVTAVRLPAVGLYGSLPSNTLGKLDALKVLSLRSNYLTGNLPSDVASIPSLQYLFLQHNNFSGSLPISLSSQLNVLDLSFNSFSGDIPLSIQKLTRLATFYVQNNSISGAIPDLNLPKLKLLNLSYNNLSGSIPNSLQKFPNSSFVGNSLLCGQPLSQCPTLFTSPSPSPAYSEQPTTGPLGQKVASKKKLGSGAIVALVIGCFALLFLLVVVVLVCYSKRKDGGNVLKVKGTNGTSQNPKDFGSGVQEPEKNKLVFFDGCSYNFDLEDLLRASAEVLGKGSYGTAYKAILEEGTTLVVKRLREVAAGKKEFEQQMELVGKVGRHANVVPLRAYYYSKDEKLLVYDYMPYGSLFVHLHGDRGSGRTPLDWDSRMKISLGTAKAIAHIHSEPGAKCVHGNIKSLNVFLTQDHDGCVSDVGLTPLMNFSAITPRVIGYYAPEVIESRKVTQKSDVYSFGVLLLEMLTGKTPLNHPGHDDVVDLPRWVRSVVREEWTAEVFDVELLKYENVEEEMVQMLQIALTCVAKVPDTRPKMDEVVRMIEEVREPEVKDRPSSGAESNVPTP